MSVLFEDDTTLVLDKPSGAASQPLRHGEARTALGAAVAHCATIEHAGPPLEGGLCHRLDGGTSGCLLFAKDEPTHARLRAALTAGQIEKRYWALVHDPRLRLREGMVLDQALSGTGAVVQVQASAAKGSLSARTEVRRLRRGQSGVSWVEVLAKTGRRHQIRVHLSAVDAPILGDDIYGGADAPAAARLCLHARTLILPNAQVVSAPVPAELLALLRDFGLRPDEE
jgi:23S rRNA-/tRNA-specific pseudouridylate synthase